MSIVIPDPATTKWVPLSYGATIQTNVPACRVYSSVGQGIPNGVATPLTFDSERFDTDNIHDVVTNNTRLTCKTAGKYLVFGNVNYAYSATGRRLLLPRINGSAYITDVELNGASSTSAGSLAMAFSTVWDFVVGDYVELCVYQDSGAGLNVLASPNYSPEFGMSYFGPGLVGRGQQNLVGTYLTRPAANTVPPGTTYFAADALGTWVSDGTQWYLTAQRPAFGAASILTLAPWTTPYDGMEILLTDSFANPVFMWHFRYNAGSTQTWKWEFVGGTEYVGYSSANVNVPSVNTWTNIVASAILPPRNGEYTLKASLQTSHANAGNTSYVTFWAGSVPGGVFGPAPSIGTPVAGGYSNIFSIGPFKAALGGGVGIGVAAQNNVAGGNYSSIQWSMIPTRIS